MVLFQIPRPELRLLSSVQFTLYRNFAYIALIIYLNAICHTLLIHSLWLTMTVVVTWLRVHLNS